jgi:hypothetical protein
MHVRCANVLNTSCVSVSDSQVGRRAALWTGGWADLTGLINGELVIEAPDFVDLASCVAVAEGLVARLLA